MTRAASWAALLLLLVTATLPGARATALDGEASSVAWAPNPPGDWPAPAPLQAPAALLMDADTGQVLVASNADERRPVASTLKVLTALTVLRRAELDDLVVVGDEVVGFPALAAGVGLAPGQIWSVEELLDGLVARSGNDAAAALARHVGGSVEGFLELMRADAQELGVHGTIASVDGLGDADRLSARELATITRAALGDDRFADIAGRAIVDLPGVGPVRSRNMLLASYPGADGVKTGFTTAAGRCLIATATRDGRRLLAVVLGSGGTDGHFADARALLDYGFSRFLAYPVIREDLALRGAGRWITLDSPSLEVLAVAPVVRRARPPIELDGREPAWVDVSSAGELVVSVPLALPTGDLAIDLDGAPAVGSWLADRVHAGLRAALRVDGEPSR